ncbi:MAG: protein kinase [Myxococcales bacterium]|nr:protein kinase [Myxococcales bacterium]
MTALKAGMVLGNHRYELVSCLGKGGQAQVWEARQGGIGGFSKSVVLKILEFDDKSEKQRSLLLHEARIIAQLQHPNLVSIFDVDEVPPYLYIAMEYVNGYDLEELLTHVAASVGKRYLPWQVALAVFRQVCRGLYQAHTATDAQERPFRLIHRDLKPNNLLLGRNGIVKIIDFGIAKSTANTHKTQTGVIRGTPAYMSPEQIQSKELDARSDIYSVGVILYEICAGTNPFANPDTFTTMIQVSQMIPPPLREFVPDCPPALESLLSQMLSKDPEQRPDDARQVYRQIEQILRECNYPHEQEDVADWLILFQHSPPLAFSQFGFSTNPRQTILDPGANARSYPPPVFIEEKHTTTTSNEIIPRSSAHLSLFEGGPDRTLQQDQFLTIGTSGLASDEDGKEGQTITMQALSEEKSEEKAATPSPAISLAESAPTKRPRPPMLTMPDFPRQTEHSLPAHGSETSEIDKLLSSLFSPVEEKPIDALLGSLGAVPPGEDDDPTPSPETMFSPEMPPPSEADEPTPISLPSNNIPPPPPMAKIPPAPPPTPASAVQAATSLRASAAPSLPPAAPPLPSSESGASVGKEAHAFSLPPKAPSLPPKAPALPGSSPMLPPKAPQFPPKGSEDAREGLKEETDAAFSSRPPFAPTRPSEVAVFLPEPQTTPSAPSVEASATETGLNAVKVEDVEKPEKILIEQRDRRKTVSFGEKRADESLIATQMNIASMPSSPRDTIEQAEFFKATMEIGPLPSIVVERGEKLSLAPSEALLNAATFTNLSPMTPGSSGKISVVQNKRSPSRGDTDAIRKETPMSSPALVAPTSSPAHTSRSADDLISLDELDLVTATGTSGGGRSKEAEDDNAATQAISTEKLIESVPQAFLQAAHEEPQAPVEPPKEEPAFDLRGPTVEDMENPLLRVQSTDDPPHPPLFEEFGPQDATDVMREKSVVIDGQRYDAEDLLTEGRSPRRGRGVIWAMILLATIIAFIGVWILTG